MKVLIVDDTPVAVKGIVDYCTEKAWESKIISFEQFDEYISDYMPDVIVLDWKDDVTGSNKGNDLLEQIWSTGFKPIIIFSGYAGGIDLEDKYRASNLVKIQEKGDEEPVAKYLDMICPFVPVITGLKDEFNTALIEALNSIETMNKTGNISAGVMKFIFAKRVSTYFDKECGEDCPPPWIQYVYPPITNSLCVCDIIRKIPADNSLLVPGEPDEYLLILTPSCDMAQNKVSHVLCARSYSKTDFHKFGTSEKPSDKQLERIVAYLNTGYNNSLVSLPGIPEVLPYLSIDLKKLEFLPMEKIALHSNNVLPEQKYCRIASIDSPFREQIVWAHMINSCRPGMPNRDTNLWAKDLMKP